MTMNSFHMGLKLDYIKATLQEVITQANSMGDHNIDIGMVEEALIVIEEIKDPYFELKKEMDEEVRDA